MYEIPRDWRQAVSPRLHLKIRPVFGRPDRVVVASGGRSAY
jgi:hypothetical protein